LPFTNTGSGAAFPFRKAKTRMLASEDKVRSGGNRIIVVSAARTGSPVQASMRRIGRHRLKNIGYVSPAGWFFA
jgi:hypothetical protein